MIVAAVPVHNEADHIEGLLASLARQTTRREFEVVLLLNNCTDATSRIVGGMAPSLPFRVHAHDQILLGADANAGMARRLAMEQAARVAGPSGILLTTDADSALPPDWIGANLAALAAGADAVAGRAEIDPADEAALPPHMVAEEERVQHLTTLLDRIDWLVDPDPADPWPRHTQNSGASIAVSARTWRRVGGVPALPLGEDRAFFDALRRHDALIRHASDVFVTVSGRLQGRAKGGMADTMLRRMTQPDPWLDDNIEPARNRLLRADLRRIARQAWWTPTDQPALRRLATSLHARPEALRTLLQTERFGEAWQAIEAGHDVLRRHPVPSGDLEEEIARTEVIVNRLLDRARPATG